MNAADGNQATTDCPGYETEYIDSSDCSYFDSDEEKEKIGGRKKRQFSAYNPRCNRVIFTPGITFKGESQFKEALSRYSIEERKDLMFTKNTMVYVRMRFKKPKCPWHISSAKDSKTGVF